MRTSDIWTHSQWWLIGFQPSLLQLKTLVSRKLKSLKCVYSTCTHLDQNLPPPPHDLNESSECNFVYIVEIPCLKHILKKTPQMLAHPPCFGLLVSPTYCSLCLLLFGKWLLLSWVTGQNQAMHISLKARRTTLMAELELSGWEESKRSSRIRHCLDQGKPQLTPSSTGTSITIQKHSFCPAIILLLHLLHHGFFSSSAQASSLCESAHHWTIRSAYVCWHMWRRLPALWFKISIYSYDDKGIPLIPL